MNVGIDAAWAARRGTGTATYTRGLVTALAGRPDCDLVLYFQPGDEAQNDLFALHGPNIRRRVVAGHGQIGRTWMALPRAASRDELDVFHAPGYFLPPAPCRRYVTFHDANVFLQWKTWWRPGMRLGWASLAAQTAAASRLADTIVTDSQVAAGQIQQTLRIPAERLSVVYPGVDDRFFAPPPAGCPLPGLLPGSYVLSVGVLSPQKNLEGMVRAFALAALSDLQLVFAGRRDGTYFEATVLPLVHELGIAHRVREVGVVDEPALHSLYAGACAFLFPSFAEGFGLPPLEAMAVGTPVVASNVSCLPEILSDAALLVDPHDASAIAEALQAVVNDAAVRRTLRARGKARAQRFRWSETAAKLMDLYRAGA